MKQTKVSLYEREPITRRYRKINPKKDYPSTTTFVLRYGSTWETLKVNSVAAATAEKIQRELDLLKGWRPTAKPRTESASKIKMLDAARRCRSRAELRGKRAESSGSTGRGCDREEDNAGTRLVDVVRIHFNS